MTTLAIEQRQGRGPGGIGALLRKELAPFPGRMDAVWRYVISSAVVIVCSMALQIPFLALSLIAVFFTAHENTVLSRLSGVLLLMGTTLGVALPILLFKFTLGYPMWRVLGAFAIGFCAMYFMRISKLGAAGFLAAVLVVYAQSLADIYDQPEMLTRGLLWVWVAESYGVLVAVAVNELFRPAQPVRLLIEELTRQLNEVDQQLEARRTGQQPPALSIHAVERGVLLLHRHLEFATQSDATYRQEKGRHLMRIAAIDRLHTAAAHLSQLPPGPLDAAHQMQVEQVQASCAALARSLAGASTFNASSALPEASAHEDGLIEDGLMLLLREMAHALHAFAEAGAAPVSEAPLAKQGLLAADAFTNPAYGKFALKAMLAAMLCYAFYTGVQWPGIHTSMLTCIILALPSLGATSQKGLNRVVGCAIGSVISLVATVFIVPHLDSIVGLLGLTLPVIALGAWIAAGSPRSSYAGVQIMFAFALALLGHFGPTTDVTEIRDRMLGILLGIAVSLTVSALLWPQRDGDSLRTMLGRLLRAIADLVRAGAGSAHDGQRGPIDRARLQGWSLLSQNRELQARIALEPGWQYDRDSLTVDLTTWLADAQELLFAVSHLQLHLLHAGAHWPASTVAAIDAFLDNVAQQLEWMASRLQGATVAEPAASAQWAALLVDSIANDPASKQLAELRVAAGAVRERMSRLVAQSHLDNDLTTRQA